MHLDIKSTPIETNAIPMIFSLLPNKTQVMYNRLFTYIKRHILNVNPGIISMGN